jgi:hypothetical protein
VSCEGCSLIAETCRSYHTWLKNWKNNWCICWFSRIFLLGILIFKGLTARRLYKSFGVKGLSLFLRPFLISVIFSFFGFFYILQISSPGFPFLTSFSILSHFVDVFLVFRNPSLPLSHKVVLSFSSVRYVGHRHSFIKSLLLYFANFQQKSRFMRSHPVVCVCVCARARASVCVCGACMCGVWLCVCVVRLCVLPFQIL